MLILANILYSVYNTGMKIKSVQAIEILDSRGKPTIRTFLRLDDESIHTASVPSGASTGTYESVELRDSDQKRHLGQGVLKAVENVNTEIAKAVDGMDITEPKLIDAKLIALDGTENKKRLGANAILSVSMAAQRAAAHIKKKPLWQFINEYYAMESHGFPRLMVNVVNGGKHAGWNFDIQEFMICPIEDTPSMSIRVAAEIFQNLGRLLKKKNLGTLVGDEGGYSPALSSNEEVLGTIITAAKDMGYENMKQYELALDSAASEFFDKGNYTFKKSNKKMTCPELAHYYGTLYQRFHIFSFEDPFAEDDWNTYSQFTNALGDKVQIVGDDLYVTNPKRIKMGIQKSASNAVLIKPNQIGTIMETIEAIKLTQKAGWEVVISHRSGETEDSFIADLAYGVGADFIKTGSMSRSERLAKYNRLIEIENNL